MYAVEIDAAAVGEISALPGAALPFYAELMTVLEVAPWSGDAFNRSRPDANIRTHTFGSHSEGLIAYLILDDQRRVVVLRVLWMG